MDTAPNCKKCQSRKCVDYYRENTSAYAKDKQDLTIEKASSHREPWTEEDFRVLSDTSLTQVQRALLLRRSYGAVVHMAWKVGVKQEGRSLGDPLDGGWKIDAPNAA